MDEVQKDTFNVLVVCEPEFNRVDNQHVLEKLMKYLSEQFGELAIGIHTTSGKYGIKPTDTTFAETLKVHEVEDKNKTTFVECVENVLYEIDLIVIYSKNENSVLHAVLAKCLDNHISGKIYGY